MKEMLNWDLFTHPRANSFTRRASDKEKVNLALQWKNFMNSEEIFISFYEWELQKENFSKLCPKILVPKKENPICFPAQTLSISDIGKEINRLKKSIKVQENNKEQEKE
jgi:hypothetical protein